MMRLLAVPLLALALTAADAPPASIDGLPIGGLAPQPMPKSGCAAYLFSTGTTRTFAAMALAEPPALRLSIGGRQTDFARVAQEGSTARGFPAQARFAAEGLSATLAMTVAERSDLQRGATVQQATLTIDRAGQDSVVVPLAGLVACAS